MWMWSCVAKSPSEPDSTPEAPAHDSADGPHPAPQLSAVDPPLGDVRGGSRVLLSGEGLWEVLGVRVGGEPCGRVEITSGGEVRCTVPALPAGSWDVEVSTPDALAVLEDGWEAWTPASLPGARLYQSDAGLSLDAPVAPGFVWRPRTRTAPWAPRDGAGLEWHDGALWLLGGWNPALPAEWGGAVTTNEVWRSDDLGATWTAVLPHDPAPPDSGPGARWAPRHTAGWLVHPHDGAPQLTVVGGDIYHVSSDTWRSPDGVTWEQVSAAAPWHGRVLQIAGSHDGALYVLGGQLDVEDPDTALRDVWRSDDGGASWTQLADAPWAPRGMVYDAVSHAGRLWVVGGGTYAADTADRAFRSDVWAFDGATWEEVSPDGDAPWSGRQYHAVVSWGGELWVVGGYGADGLNHHDVWRSSDGVTWVEVPRAALLPGHADGVAATPGGLVAGSGNAMVREVFALDPADTALLTAWADQGGGGADLAAPGPGSRPLVVARSFGALPGVAFDGTDGLLQLEAFDAQPAGRSVFFVGSAGRRVLPADTPNAGSTVVGDSAGSCRSQLGYADDVVELVVTDAVGSWADGHLLGGDGVGDDRPHLVGATQSPAGAALWVDGVRVTSAAPPYDGPYQGWDSLGAGFSGANRAEVTLGFVLVVPSVLDELQLERVATFSRKWTDVR